MSDPAEAKLQFRRILTVRVTVPFSRFTKANGAQVESEVESDKSRHVVRILHAGAKMTRANPVSHAASGRWWEIFLGTIIIVRSLRAVDGRQVLAEWY